MITGASLRSAITLHRASGTPMLIAAITSPLTSRSGAAMDATPISRSLTASAHRCYGLPGWFDHHAKMTRGLARHLAKRLGFAVFMLVGVSLVLFALMHLAPGGPEAVLIGVQEEERILAEELAANIGTINYEITCGISPRVPRVER